MATKQAAYRYLKILIPSMTLYLAASLGLAWATDRAGMPPALLYGLAAMAIAAMLSVFRGHWRFLCEVDEFLRAVQVKLLLIGTLSLLTLATVWEVLDMLPQVPAFQVAWLLPFFFITTSAASLFLTWRDGGGFQ